MSFFKKLFGAKQVSKIISPESFWNWFISEEKSFYTIIKNKDAVNAKFIQPLMEKLDQLNDQFYCLTGMLDENTAELIITAEGDIKTIVFVEELVATAPLLKGWKFTALKSATDIKNMSIEMGNYKFDDRTLHFFSNDDPAHPDEIDINLVHVDFNEKDRKTITSGSFIYLDNLLGELNTATLIDSATISGVEPGQPQLIPMEKLKDFLLWREKEFVEKYQGIRHDTHNDTYSILEAKDKNGLFSISIINQDLLAWDATASHPWMMLTEIKYDGSKNNGMPQKKEKALMDQFEDELSQKLPDHGGYLNLGKETYNSKRTIYFACNEFRKVSKVVAELANKYGAPLYISYDIFKDKYWKLMNSFRKAVE